jgi:ribonuclease HI
MPDKKKHYYAVVKGRRPGIYTQWTGTGGAEEQIKSYPGAVYRGFATREEAQHYLRTGGGVMPLPPMLIEVEPVEPASQAPEPLARQAVDYRPDLAAGKVVIFTDGASTGNPGPGGYGVVLMYGKSRRELSGGFCCTTNNRMELLAVIAALRELKRRSEVVLYSDSRYVVDAVEMGWARRWRARGWMRDNTNRAENADLWAQLLDLLDQHAVEFRWVRGHANHPENERCDRLAVRASRQAGLPPDVGFEGAC